MQQRSENEQLRSRAQILNSEVRSVLAQSIPSDPRQLPCGSVSSPRPPADTRHTHRRLLSLALGWDGSRDPTPLGCPLPHKTTAPYAALRALIRGSCRAYLRPPHAVASRLPTQPLRPAAAASICSPPSIHQGQCQNLLQRGRCCGCSGSSRRRRAATAMPSGAPTWPLCSTSRRSSTKRRCAAVLCGLAMSSQALPGIIGGV